MKYKDFFQHIERRVEKKNKRRASEDLIRNASEKLAERLNISTVEALSLIQERLDEKPKSVIREWMKAKKENKKPLDGRRLKDKADAPTVGDSVKIQFNEKARGGHLTPQQKKMNGRKGTVKNRDPLSTGSQRARYTVEVVGEGGNPHKIHNLTPGEVKKV